MKTHPLLSPRHGAALAVLLLASACTDSPVTPTVGPSPHSFPAMECRVDVVPATMSCSLPEEVLNGSVLATRTFGGQERYVKLTNFNTSFANDVFETYVTVQNLLADPLGTTDGNMVTGVRVFFYEDPTDGVTVANATGTDFFTSANQPYFLYNQILSTYEVSSAMAWQFNVPNGVLTFSFRVYINASQVDESGNGLDAVWDGSFDTNWGDMQNWTPAAVPGASSAVQIPPAANIPGAFMPVLQADASALHVRVGAGSTLGLGGNDLAVGGNVDGVGPISGGSVTMSGSGALLKGTIPTLFVTGSTFVQGAVNTTGAVSVTGSLTVADSAMSISLP